MPEPMISTTAPATMPVGTSLTPENVVYTTERSGQPLGYSISPDQPPR